MPTSPITIPLPLRHALELGECVLFLGAGIGRYLITPDGNGLPDATALAKEIAVHFSLNTSSDNLSKVAELLHIRNRKDDLTDFIRKRFADLTPDESILWLCSRRWRAIYTTNYDRGIERGYELLSNAPQTPIPIIRTADLVHLDPRFEVPIYHIHGAIFGGDANIVISQTDLALFRETRRMLFELLKNEFATSTILYIGYSNRDPNWSLLLNEIAEELQPVKLPTAYRVVRTTQRDDEEILRARGIVTIEAELQQFIASADTQLEPLKIDNSRLESIKQSVPRHLLDSFTKNPAPVARLISSWQSINQAPFSDTPNIKEFFHGDLPNWSLIGADRAFSRDIEDDIYNEALDYVTSTTNRPKLFVVLGPAGYGITTILMNLAARFVKERVGHIYFLNTAADILEGDVEFAIAAAESQICCFIIDDAADCAQQLQNTIARLRDEGRSALFICGSRMNEWRQQNLRVGAKEYDVDSLSDDEIEKLLDCLSENHELNKLEPLSRDLQRAVIREKHGKELLVVMREATENKSFDAILEDEFHSIIDDKCREIYLTVCCFYQLGGYIRAALLAAIADMPIVEFYDKIKGALDGVVIEECIDSASGQHAFRARHRIIAQIVWDRCGENTYKETIVHSALKHLNLNYRADALMFEKFVRNDYLIDSIRGLENKIKFFDLACKKDPESPYVRQHYARMLYREERLELALSQVDQGIELSQHAPPRVLLHTKGVILGALALQAENKDIGRRRLAQAEDILRHAMRLNQKDDYTYQALAKLYLDWAKCATLDEECATYITQSEEVISEGLRLCREKDALWIVSAEIERWLGNWPSHIKALQKAVADSPGSIVARYLLGKACHRLGKLSDALIVLEPNIKNYPDEFRSFVEYALIMTQSGKPLREAIAVLEIASTTGLSDPRYIAHLGGMLFMDGNFSRAKDIFSEAERRDLSRTEQFSIFFHPGISMTGTVIVRRPTYSLIECEGYPPIFCHSSKYRGLILKQGMRITFELGFSPRGAVALSPHELK